MYKLDLPLDPKEQAKIDFRRRQEEERKQRIFAEKPKAFDVPTITEQMAERRRAQDLERAREEQAAQEAIRTEKLLLIYESRQDEQRREQRKATDSHNLTTASSSRQGSASQEPKPDPSQFGVSSLQFFAGDDLDAKKREREAKQVTKQSLLESMQEKERARQQQRYEQQMQDLEEKALLAKIAEMEVTQQQSRSASARKIAEENRALAAIQQEDEAARKVKEEQEKISEIVGQFYGDLLSETRELAFKTDGTKKVLPDRYKGMSKDEIDSIHTAQTQQIEDLAARRRQEADLKAQDDRYQITVAKAALIAERQVERERKQILKQTQQLNQTLTATQSSMRATQVVVQTPVEEEFFKQFGTTTR